MVSLAHLLDLHHPKTKIIQTLYWLIISQISFTEHNKKETNQRTMSTSKKVLQELTVTYHVSINDKNNQRKEQNSKAKSKVQCHVQRERERERERILRRKVWKDPSVRHQKLKQKEYKQTVRQQPGKRSKQPIQQKKYKQTVRLEICS